MRGRKNRAVLAIARLRGNQVCLYLPEYAQRVKRYSRPGANACQQGLLGLCGGKKKGRSACRWEEESGRRIDSGVAVLRLRPSRPCSKQGKKCFGKRRWGVS